MEKKNIKKENLKKGPQFESAKNESSYYWVKKSWQMNQNEKTRIRRHFRLCLSLVSNGKGTNLHTDGSIKKKKRQRSTVQCSTHWVAGNLPWMVSIF